MRGKQTIVVLSAVFLALVGIPQTVQADVTLNSGETHTVGVGATTSISNALLHYGYHINNDNLAMNLHNNGGMMGGGDPLTFQNLYGRAVLTDGPGNRGLDFNNDGDFINTGAIGQNDNYSNLWVGMLNVNAANAGDWEFQRGRDDDKMGIWLDIDDDGVFESSAAGLGSNRGEQLQWDGNNSTHTVNLAAGDYMVAFTHREGGGGSNVRILVKSPTMAAQAKIKPTDPAQNGYFSYFAPPDTALGNITVNGDSTIEMPTTLLKAVGDSLTFNNPATLTINSADLLQELEITGTTTLGANDATLNLTGSSPIVTLSTIDGSGGLTIDGSGTVNLTTANPTYTGLTTVDGGVLSISNGTALGTTALGTVVNDGGSLRLTGGGNFGINEPLTLSGGGNAASDGALHSQGNNHDVNGPITLAADATIRKDGGGDMEFRSGIDTAGHELRIEAANTIRIFNNGLSGSGTLVKEENGVLEIRTNSPSFTGTVNINNGYIDVNNQTNPFGTAVVTVASDGTLRLRDGVTIPNDINISTDGEGTAGAIRSENNSNTITGQVNVAADSRIHVNNTQLTLSGVLTGPGAIDKQGDGKLILANAANDFTGATTINNGTISATSAGSLGATPGIAVGVGGTLELDGAWDYPAIPLSIAGPGEGGVGALNSVNGDNVVASPIDVTSSAAIGSNTAGSTLTVDGQINLLAVGDLSFVGAGDTVVNTPVGNGTSPFVTSDTLAHYGYHINSDGTVLDLDANGGMMGSGDPADGPSFNGMSLLTSGPGGRGLDFNNDTDFIGTGSIGQNDSYSNLWVGKLTVSAADAGDWKLRNAGDDDRAGIWFDLDQDGTFESSTPGLGSNRDEQLSWEDGGAKTVTLAEGEYMVAFTHREGGGGSRADFRFTKPGGSEAIIKPADSAQAGLWSTLPIMPDNGLVKEGSGTLTLNAANSYNGETKIFGGTLIATDSNSLGTNDGGTTVENNATLALTGSIDIGDESLAVANSTLVNLDGDNIVGSGITVAQRDLGQVNIDSQSGSIEVQGGIDLQYSKLNVTGDGDTTITGAISGLGVAANINTLQSNGLFGYYYDTNNAPNSVNASTSLLLPTSGDTLALESLTPRNSTPILTPRVDFGSGTITNQGDGTTLDRGGYNSGGVPPWQGLFNDLSVSIDMDGDNIGGLWTGYVTITNEGDYTFTTRSDDGSVLFIDGQQVVNNNYNQGMTNRSGTVTLTPGRHEIKIGFFEAGGGAGVQASYSGPDTSDNRVIIPPTVLEGGVILRANNDLLKQDQGILTLDGDNTYEGITSVEAGTLLINGTTSGQGDYIVAAGATLGGSGTIGLAAPAAVTMQAGSVISPGVDGPDTLSVDGDMTVEDGTSYFWELGTTGNDIVDLTGDLTLEDGWTLQLVDDGGEASVTDKLYLFTGFDSVDPADDTDLVPFFGTLDFSLAPAWLEFTDPANVFIGLDANGLYITGLQTVPEPSTLLLMGIGMLALLRYARRRKLS